MLYVLRTDLTYPAMYVYEYRLEIIIKLVNIKNKYQYTRRTN
jgi:hypothetical protein